MATVQLLFGPANHGRRVSLAEFEDAEFTPGFHYELIEGRLYVSPAPNFAENFLESWLRGKLELYALKHPHVIAYISTRGRVFLPANHQVSAPEPDLAIYSHIPSEIPLDEIRWEDLSPILVCEILVEGSIEKDLGRNPKLYLAVPSIKEYWVLNGSENPERPSLIHHRRHGKSWKVQIHPFGSPFTSKLLPDFQLVLNPRK